MINIRRTLAILACLALIAVISVLAWAILRTNRLESAAQELALRITEESFATRYPDALIDNLHPEYTSRFSTESMQRYLTDMTGILGTIDSLVSIRGSADIPLIPNGARTASANYEVEVNFSNAPASVQFELLLINGRWLVSKFEIASEVLVY